MKQYTVKFIIESIDANSPLEAAKKVTKWIAEGGMTFSLQDESTKQCFSVDLSEKDKDATLPLAEEEF